jgi:PAS domain-containing protein
MSVLGEIRCDSHDLKGLQEEVLRRDKIIDALVYQVERSLNDQGRDYGLLQTTVVLEEQIRQRTEELTAALEALGEVSARATAARLQLETAVDNISDGFALFDPEDRCSCATRPSASSTALPAMPATAHWVTYWPKPPAAIPRPAGPFSPP